MNTEASLNFCSPYLDLAKSSYGWLPRRLHKEIPKKKHTVQPLNFELSPNSQQQQQSIIRGH
jgi:hypothetical protein